MFVADVPPDVPPAYIETVCDDRRIDFNNVDFSNLTVDKLVSIANSSKGLKAQKEETLKLKMIAKNGFAFGAQGGYYQRVKDIKLFLKQNENNLDSVFNFQSLMLFGGRVVPAVIGSVRNTYNQENDDLVRMSALAYKIDEQARFSSVAPNWRTYLYFGDVSEPKVPDRAILPKTPHEKEVWEKSIRDGWNSGICQADKAYAVNIAKLRHDYIGMVRYHILMKKGIVSAPFVAKTDEKIVGDKDNISIGDMVLRITVKPGFELNASEWDALVQQDPFYKNAKHAEAPVGTFSLKSDALTGKESEQFGREQNVLNVSPVVRGGDRIVPRQVAGKDSDEGRLSIERMVNSFKEPVSGSGMQDESDFNASSRVVHDVRKGGF